MDVVAEFGKHVTVFQEPGIRLPQDIEFKHRHKQFRVRVTDEGALELYLDNCLRKRREPGDREPRYVWTNVELEWEEHHYVEARFWPGERRLRVDVNGTPVLEKQLAG